MRRWRSLLALVVASGLVASLGGCGAAEGELDPEDLSVRDLLGLDPHVAMGFSATQRAAARRVLDAALAAPEGGDGSAFPVAGGGEATLAALVHGALVRTDVERERRGAPPLVLVRIEQEAPDVWVQPLRAPGAASKPADAEAVAWSASGWDGELAPLPARGHSLLGHLATVAGRDVAAGSTMLVQPVARAPFAAAYVASADLLLVNPVLLAALEPAPGEAAALGPEASATSAPRPAATPGTAAVADAPSAPSAAALAAFAKAGSLGNPYAFFGSLGECSAAQQQRCEACLPTTTCTAVTRDASDGNAECTTLAAGGGRGYYELCLNVALAIRTVSTCVEGRAPAGACAQVFVGNQLASLATNDAFLDDATCVAALDACLAELYGAPSSPFPTGPDAGPGTTPPPPPRDVDVSCGDCSNDASCSFSPQCDPQCDSSCQGGSCGDCSRGDGTGSGSSSGGGCGSCDSGGSSSSSSSSCDSGCDSSGSSSSSGGSSCGSCDSGGDSSSGGSSCSSSCDKSDSSGSGSSGCSAAPRLPGVRAAVNLVSVGWACLPLVVLFAWRRRELRRLAARRAGGAS